MLITIEGCVGVGKTTVSQGLARQRGSMLLLEDFESNPFLKSFYADPQDNALEVEFTFLLLHYRQLRAISTQSRSSNVVADFHLWKDLIYGDLNLSDPAVLRVFRELHEILSKNIPVPSVLVMLSASTELLLERISQRGREYEQLMPPGYFARLNDAYESAFGQYKGRKLRVPMDRWDFVRDPDLFESLDVMIERELEK
jgi:deoxyguanosine kinase